MTFDPAFLKPVSPDPARTRLRVAKATIPPKATLHLIQADLYSGRLFEYWEPKARPLDATGHQPSQYEDKHRDRSKHEAQSYNDDERRKNIRVGTRPVPADGFYEWKKVVGEDSVFNRNEGRISVSS